MFYIFFFAAVIGLFLLIRYIGNSITDAKWSKRCPRCGHMCKPDKDTARMYWKGTGGYPAFFYTCPNCGNQFTNG